LIAKTLTGIARDSCIFTVVLNSNKSKDLFTRSQAFDKEQLKFKLNPS